MARWNARSKWFGTIHETSTFEPLDAKKMVK